MNLVAIKPVLLAWVAQATGLSAVWADDRRGFYPGTEPHAFVSLRAPTRLGVDETRWQDITGNVPAPPAGEDFVPYMVGSRTFVLSIVVETLSHVPGEEAATFLELARTRLRAPSALEAFRAVGVAVVEDLPLVEVPTEIDQRVASVASLDIRFATTATFEDLPTTFVEHAEITPGLTGPDGDAVTGALTLPLET